MQNLLFLNNIEQQEWWSLFDSIIYLWEKYGDNMEIDSPIPIEFLPNLWGNFIADFKKLSTKYKNSLCIVDQLSVSMLWDAWENFNWTIVNLFIGISSLWYKTFLELNDIVEMQEQWFDILEPYDLWSFLKILTDDKNKSWENNSKKYIRLTGVEISAKLLQDEHERVREDKLLSMDKFGLGWGFATVLTSGNYLWTVIQSAHILNEQWTFVDVYAILNYNFTLRDDLKKSVARTEKLIVILDAKKDVNLEKLIVSQFPLQKWLEIRFIYPEYEKVTAYMDEYRPDQARFDQVGLMERILVG